jgi:beta-glucosidase
MAAINPGTLSPVDEDVPHIDIKGAAFHVQPVTLDTPSATPATTPDHSSPLQDDTMAGKKLFSLERPDDRARELAAKLTLEEQVCFLFRFRIGSA